MVSNNVTENLIRDEKALKRPLTITTFTCLHLLVGIFYSLSIASGFFYHAFVKPDYGRAIPKFVLAYFVILLWGSVVGMWKGKTYGWWCTTLLYMGLVFKIIIQIGISLNILPLDVPAEGVYILEYKYFILAGSLIVYSSILLSFFRKGILEYFNIPEIITFKAIAILSGVTIAYYSIGQIVVSLS